MMKTAISISLAILAAMIAIGTIAIQDSRPRCLRSHVQEFTYTQPVITELTNGGYQVEYVQSKGSTNLCDEYSSGNK
jgi:hypothetical protein